MIPPFRRDGALPVGLHDAAWTEAVDRFGGGDAQARLLVGLRSALDSLSVAGCTALYLDGSFVTATRVPGDFDACWDAAGVVVSALDPALRAFDLGRASQKRRVSGASCFRPTSTPMAPERPTWSSFQRDRRTGRRKGIVVIDPRSR